MSLIPNLQSNFQPNTVFVLSAPVTRPAVQTIRIVPQAPQPNPFMVMLQPQTQPQTRQWVSPSNLFAPQPQIPQQVSQSPQGQVVYVPVPVPVASTESSSGDSLTLTKPTQPKPEAVSTPEPTPVATNEPAQTEAKVEVSPDTSAETIPEAKPVAKQTTAKVLPMNKDWSTATPEEFAQYVGDKVGGFLTQKLTEDPELAKRVQTLNIDEMLDDPEGELQNVKDKVQNNQAIRFVLSNARSRVVELLPNELQDEGNRFMDWLLEKPGDTTSSSSSSSKKSSDDDFNWDDDFTPKKKNRFGKCCCFPFLG